MPKAEKELRKDVTPLQQEVKRKVQAPGTPTDIGAWAGSADTKMRSTSSSPVPQYALQFIAALSNIPVPQFALQYIMNTTIDVLHNRIFIGLQLLHLASTCLLKINKPLEDSLNLTDTTLKSMNSSLQDSLALDDQFSYQLNPE